MADKNFTLDNPVYALSPMVLRATASAGSSTMLTVTNDSDLEGGQAYIRTTLTADNDGNIVHDISPMIRDLIARQFVRSNDRYDELGLPTGGTMYVELGEYSELIRPLWAVSGLGYDVSMVSIRDNTLLFPSGVARMYKGLEAQFEICYYNQGENIQKVLKIGKKLVSVSIRPGVKSFSIYSILSSFPPGEYSMYLIGSKSKTYRFIVEDSCPEMLLSGALVYLRYFNRWGGLSFAMLQVLSRSVNSKAEWVPHAFALDTTDTSTTPPDRLMTGNEVTTTYKAGKDGLSRAEVEELQGILNSPMVDRYDIEKGVWIPVYPKDGTVTTDNASLQEITIEFEENMKGF